MYHVNVNVHLMGKKNVIQNNGGIMISECKKHHICEKDYLWNLATCSCENVEYLASIMNDSAIMCDGVLESYDEDTQTVLKNFN